MKKSFLVFVIIALLIVSVLGLTACDGFIIKLPSFNGNSPSSPTENNKGDTDLPLVEEQQPQQPATISSVYDFGIATLQFAGMLAPDYNIDEETPSEQLAEAYEQYLEQLRDYQIYLNEINAYYVDAQIVFYNDGTAVIKFSSGDEQQYTYKNKKKYNFVTEEYISTVEMGDLVGVYEDGNLIFYMSIDDNELFVCYLDFVVAE